MTPPAADSAARSTAPRSGGPRSAAPSTAPRRGQPERAPLRVAPEPSRFRLPLRGIRAGRVGTIAGIGLFVAMFALAAFQTVIIKSQADIDATARQITEQETLQRQLDYELADLNSPQRISRAAGELGLITPGLVTYLQPEATDEIKAAIGGDPAAPDDGDGAGQDHGGAGSQGQTAP